MGDQHKLIKGYRDLSQEEIDSMNDIKTLGEGIRVFLESLKQLPDVDKRWVAIGETHLQQGIMALVRSVAKPESF